jgi:hypothetical protein
MPADEQDKIAQFRRNSPVRHRDQRRQDVLTSRSRRMRKSIHDT